MPSAMSSPSEPVETVSTSIDRLFLPSRMIEPLPKERSICESAASRAFDLSMDGPSTTRSATLIARAPYGRDSEDTEADGSPSRLNPRSIPPLAAWQMAIQAVYTICSPFAICSFWGGVLAPFHPYWSLLNL